MRLGPARGTILSRLVAATASGTACLPLVGRRRPLRRRALSDAQVGLNYICATAERFFAVGAVLGNMVVMLAEQPSPRLLKHIIRCYLRLSDNPRCVCGAALWRACVCRAVAGLGGVHGAARQATARGEGGVSTRVALAVADVQVQFAPSKVLRPLFNSFVDPTTPLPLSLGPQGARGVAPVPAGAAAQPWVHRLPQER